MLNTFLMRHINGHIQALDDLQIQKHATAGILYRIRNAAPGFITADMARIHEAVREVSPGFRTLLQKLDDDIEALELRRKEMLWAAFEDGIQLSVGELEDFID